MTDTTDEIDVETERTASRGEIADALRAIADGFDAGTVTVAAENRTVHVTPPERASFEIELDRETDGETVETELELEIEWAEPASTATPIEDADEAPPEPATPATIESLGRFEVFRDRANEWRWRLVHRNGNIIATSGEGYTTKANALKGMRSVMRNAPGADVVST